MAGTIFGLGLSQRVTLNGTPDSGWLLYLYQAASDTPVTAYKDTGLTTGLEHPWPIQADAYGMMPSFWLADGSYRARGVSGDQATTYFDLSSVLALGASSGSGGGGGGVDPNAIFQTGDVMWLDKTGTRAGWVRDNGRTIGSATSGATERANADCENLFSFVWNNFSNTLCPVSGGRGASAAADWSANKTIATPNKRGRSIVGLDDMGNSAAGAFSGVPFVSGTSTTSGSIAGENTHTLATTEIPAHTHTVTDPKHHHGLSDHFGNASLGSGTHGAPDTSGGTGLVTDDAATGITIQNTGGGGAHNNMPLSVLGTFYRKL